MTTSGPNAEPIENQSSINRATVVISFCIILTVSFALRIAYAGHLFEDDGLWFTAGEEILRGKALYSEIYFDKPPGLTLVYAALFWIFGAHILTIRLFTIIYTVAVSWVLYKFGSWLYDKRTGLLSAAMFTVFSTTYSTGHFQSLGTDFLMVLPYTAAAFLMLRSRVISIGADDERTKRRWFALAGGALAGVAFQTNPKGVFDLAFFAIILWTGRRQRARESGGRRQTEAAVVELITTSEEGALSAYRLFAVCAAGFIACSLPFLAYVAWTGSLTSYWRYLWDWGARYGGYYSARTTLLATLARSAGYFALNNTLLIALIVVTVSFFRRRRTISKELASADKADAEGASGASLEPGRDSDALLLIWFAVSFAGVMFGGRLFPHYFFQILPSLCLIGARGLFGLLEALKTRNLNLRRAVAALIAVGFLFTLVRFHSRSAILLADWARGTRSEANSEWYYEKRNQEERLVAAVVAGRDGDSTPLDGVEALRAGGPRKRPAEGPPDYLFVWGYRPEVYFWSGLLPASRYLSTQPLTGVPADVHYFGNEYRSLLPDKTTAAARAQLLRDLDETRPKYIVDELGFFNSDLSIQSYPELRAFMTAYKPLGTTRRFIVYMRRDFSKRYRERHAKPD